LLRQVYSEIIHVLTALKNYHSELCYVRNSNALTGFGLIWYSTLSPIASCDSSQSQIESQWISNKIQIESRAFKLNSLIVKSNRRE